MKRLEIDIENCVECPFGGGDICLHKTFIKETNLDLRIQYYIPDWCPLPDVPEGKIPTKKEVVYYPHGGNDFLADAVISCPFCGGEPQITFIGNDYTKKRKVEIKCKECRVTLVNAGIRSNSEQLAKLSIKAWNSRIG